MPCEILGRHLGYACAGALGWKFSGRTSALRQANNGKVDDEQSRRINRGIIDVCGCKCLLCICLRLFYAPIGGKAKPVQSLCNGNAQADCLS